MADLKNVDTIALIREVKNYPILYNGSGGGKYNTTLRTEAWESVCEALVPSFNSSEEKAKTDTSNFSYNNWFH